MIKAYLTAATALSFYSYIKRLSDGLYLDFSDGLFRSFALLVSGQIAFAEDSSVSGEYTWSYLIPDGEYLVYTREDLGGGSSRAAAEAQRLVVKFGNDISELPQDLPVEFIDIAIPEDDIIEVNIAVEP